MPEFRITLSDSEAEIFLERLILDKEYLETSTYQKLRSKAPVYSKVIAQLITQKNTTKLQ